MLLLRTKTVAIVERSLDQKREGFAAVGIDNMTIDPCWDKEGDRRVVEERIGSPMTSGHGWLLCP